MNLQQQVQQHLQNTGISLRELSRRSGVSHTTIGKILRGGTYKSDTAHALYSLISITPISEYVTLDATVEQLAAQRVNADLTHHADWDVDLQCAKYRRVMQLEAEAVKARVQADELKTELECSRIDVRRMQDVLAQREQHLRSCENALIEAHEKIAKQDAWIEQEGGAISILQSDLRDANAEIKRLTALSETHGQSWKAACVQVEQLQKQLDHGQSEFSGMVQTMGSLHTTEMIGKSVQLDDCLLRLDSLRTEMKKAEVKHDQQVMRLRVYVWILVAALVFVVASGLVVWGGV